MLQSKINPEDKIQKTQADSVSSWTRSHIIQKRIEHIGVAIIAIGLVLGILFDLIIPSFCPVDELPNVVLAILQIHATISAITIALVALISGSTSEEYYGISVSNYYLNIKPVFFKQNVIIIGSLLCVGINTLAFIIGLYNFVITVFWLNCMLIIISVVELYSAFNGKRSVIHEIEEYVDYMLFESNASFDKKADIFSNYVKYWAEQSQNKVDYELDKNRFLNAIDALLKADDCKALPIVYGSAASLVKKMLAVSDDRKRYRAYDVFEGIYKQIWLYILNCQNKHINQSFDLYDECVDEYLENLKKLSSDDLEKYVHWDRLADYILRVSIYCHDDKMTDLAALQKTMKPVRWLASFTGSTIAEKKKKGESITNSRWNFSSRLLLISCYNIPQSTEAEYKKIRNQLIFVYFRSLLDGCTTDIAETFFGRMEYTHHKYQDEEILLVLWALCYTYYIGEIEKHPFITQRQQDCAQELLKSWKSKDILNGFIEDVSWSGSFKNPTRFFESFLSTMEECEKLVANEMKSCILPRVARNFYLYVSVLSSGTCAGNHLLEDMISAENVSDWYYAYLGNSIESTRKRLFQMLEIWTEKPTSYTDMIEEGLSNFNEIVLLKFKEKEVSDAIANNNSFCLENENNVRINEIKKYLFDHLTKKISAWCGAPEIAVCSQRFVLVKYTTQVELINKEWLGHIVPHLETNLLYRLINELDKLNRIQKYERDQQTSDDDYLSFLSNGEFKYMIGSDRTFEPISYKNRNRLDAITISSTRVNLGQGNCGLLLSSDGIRIGIEELNITARKMTLADCQYEVDAETGKYLYEPATGVTLQFTKEELEEYIQNEFLILYFTVKLNLSIPQEKLGYVIVRN